MAEELKACGECGAPEGYVSGERFMAEHERVRDLRADNAALRAQASQGGEAVEVVAVAFITRAEKSGPKIAITLKKEDAEKQHKNWLSMSKIITTEPLMTVAQHQRILAASVGSGEPVAWLWYEQANEFNGYEGKQRISLTKPKGRCQPLYTHPADQVADDLTMVKVSRELLQDLRDLAFDQVEHHRAAMGAYKQTRQASMDGVIRDADAILEAKQ